MNRKLFGLIAIFLLSGCELLNDQVQQIPQVEVVATDSQPDSLCLTQIGEEQLGEFCDFRVWAQFMIDNSEIKWVQRLEIIETLNDEPVDVLKEVLLSQGRDTPYTYRLRAQNTITRLQTLVEPDIADALEILIFRPSQQHLEFESAITILTRINSQQEYENEQLQQKIDELTLELEKQREQLQKMLDIEATMVEQENSGN